MPTEANFSFLQTLHLKTVIYLALDSPAQVLSDFLEEQGIELCQIKSGEMTNISQRMSEQLVLDALHIMLTPERYPILVMCNLGRHRTGTLIGCLRRLQNWSLSNIFEEFRRYTGLKSSPMHEQFIELFDTDLVKIPPNLSGLPFKISVNPKHQIESNEENPKPPKSKGKS